MYLKKIEIHGFKSFANKIVLDFHDGITGIVGPNGSGKSNVGDAVRWVLGEQSAKQLRGGNMQDVIFSGTQIRKPQGFAYVAITLDNKDKKLPIDFEEVTVSRRIYRSGESEYKLNDSLCRLKDIQELFYDTGIGKDGYSIIGQGQVEQILNGKAEDRRKLFDEAAGITKFKQRKVVAIKKLESQEANLLRIGDIVAELEKQVGPLKRQSEVAKEYLKYKEELKIFDVNYFINQSDFVLKNLSEIDKDIAVLDTDLQSENKKEEEFKIKYESLENEISNIENSLVDIRYKISQHNVDIKDKTGKIDLYLEQIKSNKESKELTINRLSNINDVLSTNKEHKIKYENEIQDIKNQLSLIVSKKEELQVQIEKLRNEINNTEFKISVSHNDKMSFIDERSKLFASQKSIETMISQIQIRKSEISQSSIELKSKEEEFNSQKQVFLKHLEDKKSKIDSLIFNIEDLNNKKNNILLEHKKLLEIINNIKSKYQNSVTKLETLKNISERYDGFGFAIKKILESKDKISGIHGVLSDLITVDKNYEVAIETALGGRIQNIVTDTQDTAKYLIQFLKENKYGRATFLPIESIKYKYKLENTFANEMGFLGFANELLKTKDVYKEIISYLLANVLVVDTIDNAIKLSKKYNHQYKIVTLEGDLLNPGGSLSGGAYKNTSNLLGRKRELKDLEDLKNKYQSEENEKSILLKESEKNLEYLIKEIEEQKEILSSENISKSEILKNILVLDEKSQDNLKVLDVKIQEMTDFDIQLDEYKNELTQNKLKILYLDETNKNKDDENKQLSEELLLAKENYEKLNVDFSNINVEEVKNNQNLTYLINSLDTIKEDDNKLELEKETLNIDIVKYDNNIKEKEEEIKSTNIIIDKSKNILLQLEEDILILDKEKVEKSLNRKKIFNDIQETSKLIAQIDKDLYKLNQKKSNLEEERTQLSSYIWNEYELTYNMALELKDENYSNVNEIRKKIKEIKNDIRNLGSININAIEDYKDVSQRYETMQTQYEDIVNSKEELIKIIQELDFGMRTQFKEKFAQIASEFDKVFKELFGGGNARLELNEDEDILDAQIHIISQPPGKKLQNMMQLSGGEKALTAISLLFAIQNLKPSPFALLDEIEAALDDSNVDRFAKYLHKLTNNTQFIVITHRRGTMVSADRLYGITMMEKGVSTLVSVNLIEDELK